MATISKRNATTRIGVHHQNMRLPSPGLIIVAAAFTLPAIGSDVHPARAADLGRSQKEMREKIRHGSDPIADATDAARQGAFGLITLGQYGPEMRPA
jgi:hypothetical protein